MWGGISQLNDSRYEMRRVQRFPEKFQRPLSDREKMLIKKVKEGVVNDKGVRVPNIKVLDDYKCPRRERRYVMDEVRRAQNHAEMQFFLHICCLLSKGGGAKRTRPAQCPDGKRLRPRCQAQAAVLLPGHCPLRRPNVEAGCQEKEGETEEGMRFTIVLSCCAFLLHSDIRATWLTPRIFRNHVIHTA